MEAKLTQNPVSSGAPERRNKRRVRVAQTIRVRPSDPRRKAFEEVLATINVCRDGVYFPTTLEYEKGMQVFITFPYSEMPGAINVEYMGQVVRVDKLSHGRLGVAVHLEYTMNTGGSHGRVNTGF